MPSGKSNAIARFLAQKHIAPSADELINAIKQGNITKLAQAITLVESTQPAHKKLAGQVVQQCLPHAGKSIRIGITGVPGVGKSTFIESFGMALTQMGHKVAVLAVDPSSNVNKGSILGDKTRMEQLSVNPDAFIRPSPSAGALGGVANATRESIVLCEAAGFDVIIVETVGVGQSEYLVSQMVDFFLLLMLSGAGDEIQGIKRGIMEMADALVVNKADGDNALKAKKAAQSYRSALHLFPAKANNWIPKVTTAAGLSGTGIDKVWEIIESFKNQQAINGWFEKTRNHQLQTWVDSQIHESITELFYQQTGMDAALKKVRNQVANHTTTPFEATQELISLFKDAIKKQ